MFGNTKGRKDAGITLIANNCEMSGDIHFSDQLMVNGVVKGNLYADDDSKASVTVSEKGSIQGNICVPNVVVNGKVEGDIHSSRHIELAAKAEVTGNVYYNLIEMVMGSKVTGNLVNTGDSRHNETAAHKAGTEGGPQAGTEPKPDAGLAPAEGRTG